MSLDVGELVGYLRLDTKKAQTDVAQGERALVTQASKSGDKAGDAAGKAYGGALGKALKQGVGLAVGYAVFKGATKFIGDSITSARDLNATVLKSRSIFKDAGSGVEDWSRRSVKSIGVSQQAALAAAAQFGDMFTQLGQGQQQAAQTSEKVVQLAGDLASFHNLDTEDVLQRIAAGFRGEYDSLQLLIPNISANRVQTEALTETGKKNVSQLTANEKAMATLAIIQRDGANAAGNFARTSGQLANQQRIAAANAENLRAKLGAGLTPVVTQLVTFGNNEALPFLSAFGNDLVSVAHVMGPVASEGKDVIEFFGSLPPPVQAATVALITFLGLRSRLQTMGDGMKSRFSGVPNLFNEIREASRAAGNEVAEGAPKVTKLTSAIGAGAKVGLRGAASGLLSVLGGPWGVGIAGATAAIGLLVSKHQQAKQRIEDLTAAIEADSGALGENTRQTVVNQAEKEGLFKDARALGINVKTLTDALLGQADAQAQVNAQLAAYPVDRFGHTRGEALDLRQALGGLNSDLADAKQKALDHAQAMGDDATATDDTTTSQTLLGGAVDVATGKITSQNKQLKTWIERFDAANGAILDARSANRDWKQAVDDAASSLKKNGATLDINTQKGRDNAEAIDAMASAAQSRADAQKANGASDEKVRTTLERERQKLYDVARQFGLSKKAAKEYVDQVLKIPPKVTTVAQFQVVISGAAAVNKNNDIVSSTRAGGGEIYGPGSETSDSVPIRASRGEYVVNAKAYKRNRALVQAINAGADGFAKGGLIGMKAYADGGPILGNISDIESLVDIAPTTGGDVRSARQSRQSARTSFKSAKERLRELRRERQAGNATAKQVELQEDRVRLARSRLNSATDKLTATERAYRQSQKPIAQRYAEAEATVVKVDGAFISDLNKLAARGYGLLAQQLLAQNDGNAHKIARQMASWSNAKLSAAQANAQKSANQQATLSSLPAQLAVASALKTDHNPTIDQIARESGVSTGDLQQWLLANGKSLAGNKNASALLSWLGGGANIGSLLHADNISLTQGSAEDVAGQILFALAARGGI